MLMFSFLSGIIAQEDDMSTSGGGLSFSFSGAILFGNGNYLKDGLYIPSAPGNNAYWSVPGSAPSANVMNANYNNVANMVGGEARMFLNDNMAVRLNGGLIFSNTPARDNVPGIIDPDAPNVTWIPNYEAVTADNRFDANINPGFEYHFPMGDLSPFVGVSVPVYYARWSQYNPTYTVDSEANVVVTDIDTRHVELIGFGGQIVAGADYYFNDNLFLGAEIKPFSYLYAYNVKLPAPGLESLKADTYTLGLFVQPFVKLGFKF